MSSKGFTWDATADRKLLLGILKTQNVTIDFKEMADYMSTDGQVVTVSAIKNRMFKLKQLAKNEGPEDGGSTPKEKTAGRKRGATASLDGNTPTKKSKPSKGKGGKGMADGIDDGEEDTGKIKQEDGSEDELA